MPADDRPLPTPPRSRFGRDAQEHDGPASGMVSDRMALAAAEGRLEEFLQHEIPAGEHARNLAMMMMGMSGMLPADMPGTPQAALSQPDPAAAASEGPHADLEVPPQVLAAIEQGDVKNLMSILRAEHAKRTGVDAGDAPQPAMAHLPAPPAPPSVSSGGPAPGNPAGIDIALIDELLKISTANDVTMDWLMLRAVKIYVQEYQKTGRL